jgi:hypothetical protein
MTRLFDDGTMTMETAERVGYLSSAVLADSDMHRGLVSNGPIGPIPPAVAEFIATTEPQSIPAPGKPQSVIYIRPEEQS